MPVSQERIKELLGNGLSNEHVASAIGVHPSYISQLMSDEDFYNEVVELRTRALAANTVRDRSLDAIEDRLITQIQDAVESKMIYKPQDLLRTFAVINNAKRRGVGVQESTVINQTVVNLQLPQRVASKFQLNGTGEVVQVGEQTTVTMPASALLQKLAADKGEAGEKFKEVHNYLPEAAKQKALDLLESSELSEAAQAVSPGMDSNGNYKQSRRTEHQQRKEAGVQEGYRKLATGVNLRDLT